MVRMAFQEFERLLGRVPVASRSTLGARRAPRACTSFFRTSSCLTQGLVSSKRAFAVVNTDRTSVAVRAMSAVPKRSLKRRLNDDAAHRGYGVFLMSESPIVAEIMARAGHDFVVVDLEHSPAGVHAALPLLQAVECAGRDALIRVALNRPELIKKALDVGPSGLIVPLVNSAEEARAVAAACRYPPGGGRGVAHPLVRASAWGLDKDYGKEAEERCLILCQIETASAIEELDAILQVDGVDGIFVGPLDLSASLGHFGDPAHEVVADALSRIEILAGKHPNKILAGFAGGRSLETMFAAGYRLVASSADVVMLRDAAVAQVAAAQEALSHSKAPHA